MVDFSFTIHGTGILGARGDVPQYALPQVKLTNLPSGSFSE